MFEELITADKCVCCKSAGLVTSPHAFLKQLIKEFEEVLDVLVGAFCVCSFIRSEKCCKICDSLILS